MAEVQRVAAIDVGTTKICTLVATVTDQSAPLEIVGIGMSQSRGLKRGVVVDREDAIASIRASVSEAERMVGTEIPEAYVGITGDHITSTNVSGRVNVASGNEVTQADVERVLQSARDSVVLPADREIIYVAPREFILDGVRGIRRPVSMTGSVLDVEAHIVTGMSSVMANVARCVEDAGVRILSRVLEPIATSVAVVTDAERELGVVLIDIGGGTTDIAAFLNGAIAHTSSIAVAGDHVTRDIAHILRTSLEEAENIKRKWALAVPERVSEEETIQVIRAGTNARERVPRRLASEIARSRAEEGFIMALDTLRRAGVYRQINGGIVLSGGGSQLPGISQVASEVFDGLPVRIGLPRGLGGLAEAVATPAHATAVGLVMLAAQNRAFISHPTETAGLRGLRERVSEWCAALQRRFHRPRIRV
ncbi:MAG: cell division protein FtsA [Candidatus Zipacnadales bacterium]